MVRRMRRLTATCALGLAALVGAAGCGGDPGPRGAAVGGNFSLAQAQQFEEFPLYAPGEAFGDLPLTAVERRFDDSPDAPPVRANYVDFLYGTCEPPAREGGCAPPLSVQVWAACERNPMASGPELEREGPLEIRGVPGYFFEGGRRLELSTGTATVVIFATGRDSALSAANALEGINNQVAARAPLPPPAYATEQGGIISVIPCEYEDPTQRVEQDPAKATAVAAALDRVLSGGAERGDNKRVRSVGCFRSGALEAMVSIDDVHTCAIVWADGSGESWCVFSSGKHLIASTLPTSCEEAGAGGPLEPAEPPPAEAVVGDAALAWGAHAEAACGPWREKQMQALAELDPDLLYEDLSYVWFVQRPYEAGIVRDLRAIPGREGPARRAVALYERRLAAIDAGLNAWQQGKQARALERFDRAEALSLPLSRLFDAIQASACAPA
jgi:hypothetical protein